MIVAEHYGFVVGIDTHAKTHTCGRRWSGEDGGNPGRRHIDVDVALEGRRSPSSASAVSWRPSAGLLALLVAGARPRLPMICVHQVATVVGGLRSISRLTICCQRNRLAAW